MKYLFDRKVQPINEDDLLNMAPGFDEPKDQQKTLRIVYEEFRREYSNRLK